MKFRLVLPNRFMLLIDLILLVVAALGSFALRTDLGPLFVSYLPHVRVLIVVSLLVYPPVFFAIGLYRRLWTYASIKELLLIVVAVTAGSLLVTLVIILLLSLNVIPSFPRSVPPLDWLLVLVLIGGFRFAMRLLPELQASSASRLRQKRVMIVGAGDAGALVVREMQKNPDLQMMPVCFLDDNPDKQNQQIHGVPVVGTLDDLVRIATVRRINEVIVAIPSAPGSIIRQVADACRQVNIPFRTMPGIYELIGGKVNVNRLREVDITDLLRREPAYIDERRIGHTLGGRSVLVTGAGGSIGRELCRQAARWAPSEMILLGHGENSIFETLLDLEENFPSIPVHPVIADIRDLDRLSVVFDQLRPQVVFHAAAHKHVPLMETNVEDAITNNVLGTRNVVEASINSNVEQLVMVSTDKAIRPTSVMGASKRIAELIILDAARRLDHSFSIVRFGNVLGSRGSVVPLFKRQIAAGGPVTITHPDMKRYFMTIPEAVHLVLQAASMGGGGEVFILKMGEQVKIMDLAEDLIRLSGLEPGKDIEIEFTGIRPGEKLSEELWDQWVAYMPTDHPDIVLLDENDMIIGEELNGLVDELILLAREGNTSRIIEILDECIPGAAVRSAPPPDITSIV